MQAGEAMQTAQATLRPTLTAIAQRRLQLQLAAIPTPGGDAFACLVLCMGLLLDEP